MCIRDRGTHHCLVRSPRLVRAARPLRVGRTTMNTFTRETSAAQIEVAGGVDTHQDTHTAAVVDQAGRMLGHRTFSTTEAGYRQLLAWLGGFGTLVVVGVEGTGAYGACLLYTS